MSTKKVDVGGKSISCQQKKLMLEEKVFHFNKKKLMLDKKGISFRQKQDEVAQKNIFQKNYYFFSERCAILNYVRRKLSI